MEGKHEQINDKLSKDWLPTLMTNYSVWIPAQLINFKVVPPQLRVLWANVVGFFWSIYLSNAANKSAVSGRGLLHSKGYSQVRVHFLKLQRFSVRLDIGSGRKSLG